MSRAMDGIPSLGVNSHQADVPTKKELSAQDAWISRPHGDTGWAQSPAGPTSEGAQAADARARAVSSTPRGWGAPLSGRRAFASVRANRVRVDVPPLRLQGARNTLDVSRVGYSLRGVRGAVERNRLRRRLREALRLPVRDNPGLDVIVGAGPEALRASFEVLTASASEGMRRLARRITHRIARTEAENEGSAVRLTASGPGVIPGPKSE